MRAAKAVRITVAHQEIGRRRLQEVAQIGWPPTTAKASAVASKRSTVRPRPKRVRARTAPVFFAVDRLRLRQVGTDERDSPVCEPAREALQDHQQGAVSEQRDRRVAVVKDHRGAVLEAHEFGTGIVQHHGKTCILRIACSRLRL